MLLRLRVARLVDLEVWRSARESIPEHRAVIVELSADGASGWGEAPAFMTGVYASDLATVIQRLRGVEPMLQTLDPRTPADNWQLLRPSLRDCPFALAALDVAGHDLAARLAGRPLYEQLGLPSPVGIGSSYSIGLDEPELMTAKLRRNGGWSMYKVKLARPGDLDVLRRLRELTDAPFWLDGNACWQPSEMRAILPQLAELGVVALEQPFPVAAGAATAQLRRHSSIPIIADESVRGPADLARTAGQFDGINVKVVKAGGITPALELLEQAGQRGLTTMLGCLPESTLGAGAAAHLAALAGHVDLDTVALLATDLGVGFQLDERGRIQLPEADGTGFCPQWQNPGWAIRLGEAGGVELVIDGVCRGTATGSPTAIWVSETETGKGYETALADCAARREQVFSAGWDGSN